MTNLIVLHTYSYLYDTLESLLDIKLPVTGKAYRSIIIHL